MSCWTLWQRMPPRYQLTMRDIRTDDQDSPQGIGINSRASSAGQGSPRLRSPRGAHRVSSAREKLPKEGALLTTGVLPEDYPTKIEYSPQNPVLPPRSSAYINNMKNQMRINSTRRKMDEGLFVATSPTTLSYSPKPRANTAPAFPITKPSNTNEYHRLTTSPSLFTDCSPRPQDAASASRHQQPQRPQRGFSGRRSPRRPSSGYGVRDTRQVSVSTLSPFGETREYRAEGQTTPLLHHPSSPTQQDCVIGDYQVAALYVDKGRVTFFRKTKPDMTQSVYSAISPYNVTRDDGSYLSHLRKVYLTGVRDLPKMNRKQPDLEKHTTIRERMDYDRKVGRILDYYTKVDIPKDVHSPSPPEARFLIQASPSTSSQQRFRTIGYRRRGPTETTMSEVVGPQSGLPNSSAEVLAHTVPTAVTDPRDQGQTQVPAREDGGFVRINAQARLHNRHHFYLRTPATQTGSQGQGMQQACTCACGMCRLEMEVALMAQLHRDIGVSVDAVTAAHIRSSLENDAIQAHNAALGKQMEQGTMSEEDNCPARPNSVSDSRRSAAPSDLPVPVNEEEETSTATEQHHPSSGTTVSVAKRTPLVPEATSVTVTLPVIEESSELTHLAQESQTDGPDMDVDAKVKQTTDKASFLEKLEQAPFSTVLIDEFATAEEPVFANEQEQDKGGGIEDNELQSNNEKISSNDCKTEKAEHSQPTNDADENNMAEANAMKTTDDVKDNMSEANMTTQSIHEDTTSKDCSQETAMEPDTVSALNESNKSENTQSAEAENQASTADLSGSDNTAAPEGETDTPIQKSEDPVTNASTETALAEETGSDTRMEQNEISNPPEIIISLASDTEDNMTNEEDTTNQPNNTEQPNTQEAELAQPE